MAEAIMKGMIEQDKVLGERLSVDSAGTDTSDGWPATPEANTVMQERGLSLDDHKAKNVTREIVIKSDLILVMEQVHKDSLQRFSEADGKTFLLSEYVGEQGGVADPYHTSIENFREAADQIETFLHKVTDKLRDH